MHQAFSNGFVLEIQLIPTICYRLQRAPKTQEMVFYSCGVSILILGGGGGGGCPTIPMLGLRTFDPRASKSSGRRLG